MSDHESPASEAVREIKRRVASADGTVVGIDFDGTLAPIREDPDAPSITPACRDAVTELSSRPDTAVAVVSGRALSDLRDRVGIEGIVYAGNHGLELATGNGAFVQQGAADSREWIPGVVARLEENLAGIPGCEIENKTLTITVHHRNTPDQYLSDVREAVDAAVEAAAGPLDRQHGKEIVELRPDIDWDKGAAMDWLAGLYPEGWHTLYVGDDTTDEDVFEALGADDVGIHVGDDRTEASFRFPDREAVAPFLKWLATYSREGGDDSGDPPTDVQVADADVNAPRKRTE